MHKKFRSSGHGDGRHACHHDTATAQVVHEAQLFLIRCLGNAKSLAVQICGGRSGDSLNICVILLGILRQRRAAFLGDSSL